MLTKQFELRALSEDEIKDLSDRTDGMFKTFDRIYQIDGLGRVWGSTPKTIYFCIYESTIQSEVEREFTIAAFHKKKSVYLKSGGKTSIGATDSLAKQKTETLREILKGQKVYVNGLLADMYFKFDQIEPNFAAMFYRLCQKYFTPLLTSE